MSKRAMNNAGTRAKMSRDSALVMFFYMRLEKHLCNAMSHNLLLAHTVVSFDHFITSPVDKVVVRELIVILRRAQSWEPN
jgi:hypothetical protein